MSKYFHIAQNFFCSHPKSRYKMASNLIQIWEIYIFSWRKYSISYHTGFTLLHIIMSLCTHETKCLRSFKTNFKALERMLKNSGAEAVFSSMLPMMGRDFGRNM